jgi:hypothetical protein
VRGRLLLLRLSCQLQNWQCQILKLAPPLREKRRRVQSREAGALPHSSEAIMPGLSTTQEKELVRLQTDTHEGALGREEFERLLKRMTTGLEAPRRGLSDKALEREAAEAARASRKERHLKVLERRHQQQAREEGEEAKAKSQSHVRARAALEAAKVRAEAAAAALLAEEHGSTESTAGRKGKVSKAKAGITASPGSPAAKPSQARKAAAKAALAEATAAGEKAAALRTPAVSAAKLKETVTRAEGPAGKSAKWTSAMQAVDRRWGRFLLIYADEIGYCEGEEPTLEHAKAFVSYSFRSRMRQAADGKEGLGDGADSQHRYLLTQHVWPHREYKGFVESDDVSKKDIKEKAKQYGDEMHELWERLCRAEPEMNTKVKGHVKKKWSELSYTMAQDLCLALLESDELPPSEVVTRLTVMGFVRTTCARGGAFGKDWWDRSGEVLEWAEKNVMSIADWTWAREGMVIDLGKNKDGGECMQAAAHVTGPCTRSLLLTYQGTVLT